MVAAAQASAPLFDIRAGVAKCCQLIAQAAAGGAPLGGVSGVLPARLPDLERPVSPDRRAQFLSPFAENALQPTDALFGEIMSAAARHRIFVSLGFCEVSARSRGCMWNSQALISDQGVLINHHRKLVPDLLRATVVESRRCRRAAGHRYFDRTDRRAHLWRKTTTPLARLRLDERSRGNSLRLLSCNLAVPQSARCGTLRSPAGHPFPCRRPPASKPRCSPSSAPACSTSKRWRRSATVIR